MDRSSRALLRHLAKGLPLVLAPFGGLFISGFSLCGPCGGDPPPVESQHAISMAQHDALITEGSTIDPDACELLCRELRRGDAGVSGDGSGPDAGPSFSNDGTWSCSLDRVEAEEILTCVSRQFGGGCIGGRRPQGLVAAGPSGVDVGAWLAEVGHLEAASIPAFAELAVELGLHRAPHRLARTARISADDERRHARIVSGLAARFGAAPAPVRRNAVAPRSLSAIAEDNAVEGCVREAFGALVAAHQASSAADPHVRAAFSGIARDEARHALFSFALHDWAVDRLGARHARELDALRREELVRARASLTDATPARRRVLGLPDATRSADMLSLLAA